jgi:hypothetical protein
MKSATLLIAVLILAVAMAMAEPKTVAAGRTAEAPKVDGVLNEACWQQAPPFTGFVLLNSDTPAKQQTEARVVYDDRALYLGIVCREAAMGKLVATKTKRGEQVWEDDCVEVFLDPNHDHFNYFHFLVNPLGAQYDEAGDAAGVAADWSGVWEAKATRSADSWCAELAIPFATLSISRKVGGTWGLNVCREEKPSGELSGWSPTGAKFAVPQAFGELTGLNLDFAPYLLTLGVTNWGSAILGGNAVEIKLTNDGPAARDLTARLTVTPPNESARASEAPLGKIAPGATMSAKLPYQMFEAGEHLLSLEVLDAGGQRVCAATGKRVSVSPLAEFDVFKSFYRDDVAVKYQINAQPNDLARYRLQAELFGADTKPLATKRLDKLVKATGEVRFDTAKLGIGDYRVRMDVLGGSGKSLIGRDLVFPILRRPVAERLVSVDAQNFLGVRGKRVFPVGIYATPGSEKSLQELSSAGFRLVQSGALPPAPMKALLDKADQYHLRVWVSVSSLLDFSQDAEAKRKTLTELVAAVGAHPALLMWESTDEPAWGSQNAEGLYEGYKFLRALDQNHPIWTNHAPRNLISTLAYYNRATDLAGCDIYPVPEPQAQSNLPNKTIHVVGDEADKSVASVNGDKPTIMVLQGFGWAELSRQSNQKPNAVLPTFEESRFMAYDAIVHGARGINYWGTAYTDKPSRFYSDLKSLVSELAAMEPVLTAEVVTGKEAGHVLVAAQGAAPRAGETPALPGVQMMRRRLAGKTFVIAINTEKKTRKAEFVLPGLTAKRLQALFEERSVPVTAGKFSDEFGPYGVHVYTDDLAFQPRRKDFTADLARKPATEVPLYEAGNLLANSSFEIDADDDEVPDRWGANYPFTMQVSEEQAHAGKRSLMLISGAPDFAPLAVQYGVGGLKPEGQYTLSAWLKTDRPGLEFRIYVEWAGWHGKVLPWTKGTGEWQQVQVDFKSEPQAVGTIYAVVQIKGEGRGWFDEVVLREE